MEEKKLLERGGKDMINNVIVTLEIKNNDLHININGKSKKKINVKNKIINTKEIYDILKYEPQNKYILDCKKVKEEDTIGKDNEMNRLYNYVYELFDSIIVAINEINKNDKA